MRESAACPDPEVLAAFIDGRLSGEERRRVVEHLDRCPECYEVFSETVRFQGEEAPRGRVLRSERFASRRWVLPAAAAAAAAAVLVVLVALPILRTEPVISAEALVAEIGAPDGSALAGSLWPGWPRGGMGAQPEAVSPEMVSFRAGVGLVDLRAAVRARDAEAARRVVEDLARTLETAGLAPDLEESVEEIREAAAEARFDVLGSAAADLEARAGERLHPFPLAFGKWAEAGRVAAAVGDGGFLRSALFTEFLDEVPAGELPEDVAARVTEIRERTRGDLGETELAELETLFRELLRLY